MDANQLRELQSPIKQKYRDDPDSARISMKAVGDVHQAELVCEVATATGKVHAGLHPAAGGSGATACSGDMLLQSLVACSGVTFSAVATAMGISIRSAKIEATGVADFRGTLGIDKATPVGLTELQLTFKIDSEADDSQLQKLTELTERYCVVLQTLLHPIKPATCWARL